MKELSIEQKAKRYDEAVKKLRVLRDDWAKTQNRAAKEVEEIFPELKESEPEKIKESITEFFKNYSKNGTWKAIPDVTKWIAWLEKQGEQKLAWSEEDEDYLKVAIENCYECGNNYIAQWLKSLKDRVQTQPKQEWSEDTQQWIDAIIFDYESWYDADKDHRTTIQAKINILKSLKERYTWKPSDEQMAELRKYSDNPILRNLYYNLKKLKK